MPSARSGSGAAVSEQRQLPRRRLVEIAAQESLAALTARVTSERPFVERLVAFWSNHLCVSTAAKVLVAPLAGSYERDAIRPHVLGRFEDMVLASAKHPAMLVYLDNFQSIGPNSPGARRGRGRARAERELRARAAGAPHARRQRRLHAAGRAGAGKDPHRMDGRRAPERRSRPSRSASTRQAEIGFAFQEPLHEPGARTVLGVQYSDAGVEQGERVIRDLCRHPSTATIRRDEARHALRRRRPAGRCCRPHRPRLPHDRRRPSCRGRGARRYS